MARGFVETPSPSEVEGYDDAVRAGVTPRVPTDHPPAAEVSPTAHAVLRRVLVVVALAVATTVVTLLVAGRGGGLRGPGLVAVLGVSLLGVAASGVAVRRYGRVQLAELQRGYSTVEYQLGRWWVRASPDGPVTVGWVQWDWSGTWRLSPGGAVVSAPTPGRAAPGLYPSPRAPGSLELWTGHQWTGHLVGEWVRGPG